MNVHGPPPGAGGPNGPSPEKMAMYKEAGIRNAFIADIGGSIWSICNGVSTVSLVSLVYLKLIMRYVFYFASLVLGRMD
jgi:hypothetical protein